MIRSPAVQTVLPPLARRPLLRRLAIVLAACSATAAHASAHEIALNGPQTGLIWMAGFANADGQARQQFVDHVDQVLAGNPHLAGILFRVCWDDLEPQPGRLQWPIIDQVADVCRKHGRTYKLLLQPGVRTPAWVYSQGAAAFDTVVSDTHQPNYGQPVRIPLPWDEHYLDRFCRLLEETGRRYGEDPRFVAVTLTGANFLWGEMHLPKREEDLRRWQSYGDYRGKLVGTYTLLADQFARSFPRQQICLHVAPPLKGMEDDVRAIIRYGMEKYPRQWTLQSCQLDGRKDNTSVFSYRTVLEFQQALHNGFQNVGGFKASPERQGTAELTVFNLVRTEAEYWELWKIDGEDPQLCGRLLAEWRRAQDLGPQRYREELVGRGLYRAPQEDTYRPPKRTP